MDKIKTAFTKIKTLRNITWDEWGERCDRSGASIKKLTDYDSNPTISTLDSILPSVGASVEIITNEEKEILASSGATLERLQALENLCQMQAARIETFDEEIRKRDERTSELIQTISKQQDTIGSFMEILKAREGASNRKDAALHQLFVEKGVLKE